MKSRQFYREQIAQFRLRWYAARQLAHNAYLDLEAKTTECKAATAEEVAALNRYLGSLETYAAQIGGKEK